MTSITVSDIIGDIMAAFVFKTAIFGIGVASAVSYYIGASILLSHFILKKGTLRIHFDHLPWKETKKFFSLGSTSAIQKILKTMFGLTANRILLINGGASALAAYTVIMNISNLANCCGQGISGAVMLMSGVIASDSDKTSLIELCKSFIKKSALYIFILTTIIIVAARPIVYIFWTDGADISTVVTGVRIISLSFFFYTLCMCFRNYYQGIKKTRIAMFITFLLGYGLSGTFAITLGLRFGLYGVCASYPLAEITTLIFIVILVWIINKRIPSRIEDFLLLPPDFDIPEENIYEITITDLDEVMDASKKVFEFAKQHGIQEENDRRAVVLSLAVEELAKNVIMYGFKDDSSNHLDIRLCVKEDKMILRIRDDCDKFSPIDYMNQFAGHRPDKGFGITMISNLASDIKYLNTFGLIIVNITA